MEEKLKKIKIEDEYYLVKGPDFDIKLCSGGNIYFRITGEVEWLDSLTFISRLMVKGE